MTGAAQGSLTGTGSDLWAGSGSAWISLSPGSDFKEDVVGNCIPLPFPHLQNKGKVSAGKGAKSVLGKSGEHTLWAQTPTTTVPCLPAIAGRGQGIVATS